MTSTEGLARAPSTAARLPGLGLLAVGVIAAVNFAWQLGSSSFYVDEVDAVGTSLYPVSHLLHAVSKIEISPPAYYLFLHEWLYRFGHAHEWVARLPSATAGVLLVFAVYWLCSLLTESRAARLAAAALAGLSPFLLEYAQLAEPYVFAALAVTVAVAAAIRAMRDQPAASLWLAASLVAAVIALCLHYTASLAIVALCVWVATRTSLSHRWRIGFPVVCAVTDLALLPLLISQHNVFPNRAGTAGSGAVTWTSVTNMLELPLAGRVLALKALGVASILIALAFLSRARTSPARKLVLAVAIGEPLSLFVLSVLGGRHFWGHLMLTRYAAVAAPLVIVAVALAYEAMPRALAGALAGCAVAVALAGSIDSHKRTGFYFDARDAVRYVLRHAQPSDQVLATYDSRAQAPLLYYGLGSLHPRWVAPGTAIGTTPGRSWVIGVLKIGSVPSAAAALAYERIVLHPFGARPLAARTYPGIPGLLVVLVERRRTISTR